VAWHGIHFHGPPRPAALLMNLGEVSRVPWPDSTEVPWAVLAGALGLGWLSRRPSPSGPLLRLATFAAILALVAVHTAASLRYRTRDMLRFSGPRPDSRPRGAAV
jgi:hypothetical protein